MSLRSLSFLLLISFVFPSVSHAQSKVSKLIDANKNKIEAPYLYDGFALTEFTMDNKTKTMQAQFSALKGQLYKLYFCTSTSEDTLGVTVFNAAKPEKAERENILDTKIINGQTLMFEVNKAGTYTVEYAIPTCENAEYGVTKEECIVMLISYKEK